MATVNIYLILLCGLSNVLASTINSTTNFTNSNQISNNEMYSKAQAILNKSGVFQNFSLSEIENWMHNISTWTAPKALDDSFQYYLAGHTDENLPLWVIEIGKVKIRQIVTEGEAGKEFLDKSMQKLIKNVLQSILRNSSEEVSDFVAIMDFDGYRMSENIHFPTISYMQKLTQRYIHILDACLQKAVVINASYAVEVLINSNRPILGKLLEKVDVYGTNKRKWLPVLHKQFPADSLPPWYGGAKNFKPIKAFG